MNHPSGKAEPQKEQGQAICQSCGMPLLCESDFGTNADKSKNEEYCHYCFQNGAFSKDETLEEMAESCIPFALQAGEYPNQEAARRGLMQGLKKLKRWA